MYTEIKPKKAWLDVDIKGLWHYRDLYRMYILRDIVTQYKQTILGPLWYVIQPLMTTIIYMFVFGGLAGISTDGIPQPLFYMAGITLWNYFQQCFTSCSDVFGTNAGVFGKVYFPRLVVPLSSVTSHLIRLLIQFLMFIAIYIYYVASGQFSLSFTFTLALLPMLVIMVGLHAMSWGLIISSWTTKYRDLKFLITFGVQLLMYATPVIYPLSFAPEQYRTLLNINPLTPIFEAFKYSCLGVGTFNVTGLLYSAGFLVITLFLSVLIFNRTEQRFMDTV
jgi:lipopolysaccharide transport system permease protein